MPWSESDRSAVAAGGIDSACGHTGLYPADLFRILGIDGLYTDRRNCRWYDLDIVVFTDPLCDLV